MADWGAAMMGLDAVTDSLDAVDESWGSSATWVVGSNVEYSVYQEFGTSKMEAQPHLRPAVEQVMRSEADQLADQADSADELVKLIALAVERRTKELAPVEFGTLKASYAAERVD